MRTDIAHTHVSREAGWSGLVVGRGPRLLGMALGLILAAVLGAALWQMSAHPPGTLEPQAMDRLDESGVSNPVTAVLLNYRAYDTWLELLILWLAMLGSLVLMRSASFAAFPPPARRGPVLTRLAGLFVPLMVLVGGYLLWRGTHAPGGAFQAGALWAVAGVIARLGGVDCLHRLPGWLVRTVHAAALLGFLLVGLWLMGGSRALFDWPAAWAGRLIFYLEVLATLSIAVTLWSLVAATSPPEDQSEAEGGVR